MKLEQTEIPKFISVSTLATRLDTSIRTIWRLVESGRLPEPIAVTPQIRAFRESDVLAMLARPKPARPRGLRGKPAPEPANAA